MPLPKPQDIKGFASSTTSATSRPKTIFRTIFLYRMHINSNQTRFLLCNWMVETGAFGQPDRFPLKSCGSPGAGTVRKCFLRRETLFSRAKIAAPASVSYTHLDVYKRQVHPSWCDPRSALTESVHACKDAPIINAIVISKDEVRPRCLLYTSCQI